MVKTTITETTEKYDKDGNLVEKITRTETKEEDTVYTPSIPPITTTPWYPYCTATDEKNDVNKER